MREDVKMLIKNIVLHAFFSSESENIRINIHKLDYCGLACTISGIHHYKTALRIADISGGSIRDNGYYYPKSVVFPVKNIFG